MVDQQSRIRFRDARQNRCAGIVIGPAQDREIGPRTIEFDLDPAVVDRSIRLSEDEARKARPIRVEGPLRFQYRVESDGASFRVVAQADLDGDGQVSTFALDVLYMLYEYDL